MWWVLVGAVGVEVRLIVVVDVVVVVVVPVCELVCKPVWVLVVWMPVGPRLIALVTVGCVLVTV